jgi:hypothetical protein
MAPHQNPALPITVLAFTVTTRRINITEQELLNDLRDAAAKAPGTPLSADMYNETGQFTVTTIVRRFGSWNKGLQRAGLEVGRSFNAADEELFKNIEAVWLQLGRQPISTEMRRPLSRFGTGRYYKRFKTWNNALLCFQQFMNARNSQGASIEKEKQTGELPAQQPVIKHKTKRAPSERLKVQVLMRDGNKCRLCGETLTGDNIHFDHIIPWCRGGETVLENLQVLCKKHNLMKGDLV